MIEYAIYKTRLCFISSGTLYLFPMWYRFLGTSFVEACPKSANRIARGGRPPKGGIKFMLLCEFVLFMQVFITKTITQGNYSNLFRYVDVFYKTLNLLCAIGASPGGRGNPV